MKYLSDSHTLHISIHLPNKPKTTPHYNTKPINRIIIIYSPPFFVLCLITIIEINRIEDCLWIDLLDK